jgi:hypothetical protein
MAGRIAALGAGLCLLLAGCVPGQDMQQLVSNPFGQPPEPQISMSMYPPSTNEVLARRVGWIGHQIVQANKDLYMEPLFPFLCSEEPEIFHRGREIYLTEGLVKQCTTDGQLAAVLCMEMGKMVSEREAATLPETRQPERQLPIDVPVGNDSGGRFGPSDGIRQVELAKLDRQRLPRDVVVPPPSADLLARHYLQKAGYTLEDLDAVRPLLKQCELNSRWRQQLLHGVN